MSSETALHRTDLWILALLAALLVLPGLGWRDVWNPDEARYAEVAREMASEGRIWVPMLDGETYGEKPPLFFWAIRLAARVTGGIDETAVRLPSALAALGTVLLVFAMARRLFDRRTAWLSAAVFGTCLKVLWQSRFGQIDMLLTFWVTLAMWLWLRGWLEERPGLSHFFIYLFFAVTGLATLTKGPVGLLPPLLAIVVFLLVSGQRHELRRLRLGRGLLIWAAVVLAWLIPAGLVAGAGYVELMVFKQNLTRYANPWHHHQPFYYYLTVLPADFFPWSLFLPAGLVAGWRQIREHGARSEERSHRGLLFALCWVAVTLVFFSLSPAKRTVYILTMYPGLALLVGAALDRWATSWPHRRSWMTWPPMLTTGLAAVVVAALPLVGPRRPELEILGSDSLWIAFAAGCALLLGAACSLVLTRHGRLEGGVAALAAGMATLWLVVSLALLPRFDVFKSARGLSAELVRNIEPGEIWTVYPRLDAGFLFYTGLHAQRLEGEGSEEAEMRSLRELVIRSERVWVVARRDRISRVEGLPPLFEVARDTDPNKGYLLLTNRSLSRFSLQKQLEE